MSEGVIAAAAAAAAVNLKFKQETCDILHSSVECHTFLKDM